MMLQFSSRQRLTYNGVHCRGRQKEENSREASERISQLKDWNGGSWRQDPVNVALVLKFVVFDIFVFLY